jgi:cell division protein FtsI/penicillin-binding protein 2
LEKILYGNSQKLQPVFESLDKYEVQIIYTSVEKGVNDSVKLKTYSFNEDANKYFYPASTVKLPVAILALEKLNELNIEGVDKYTHISIDSVYEGLVSFDKNFQNECGYPNIADYIKRIFLVSDNESFNRLFDLLGQKEINERLYKKGFRNTQILHRLSVARTDEQNKQTNPFNFFDKTGNLIYTQPAKYDSTNIKLKLKDTKKGKGYIADDRLIEQPKDFSMNNFFGLRDQHNLLIRLFYPNLFPEDERFNLSDDDYKFLKKYMSMLPRESECPDYENKDHWDSYVKFLMFGDSKEPIPGHIKIHNKVGLAYGYLTDNAYIVDEYNNVKFFLSATISVNENQIFNDDNYEYEGIGLPFLSNLGRVIYDYELSKKKK